MVKISASRHDQARTAARPRPLPCADCPDRSDPALRALKQVDGGFPVGIELISQCSEELGTGDRQAVVPDADLLSPTRSSYATFGNAAVGIPTLTTIWRARPARPTRVRPEAISANLWICRCAEYEWRPTSNHRHQRGPLEKRRETLDHEVASSDMADIWPREQGRPRHGPPRGSGQMPTAAPGTRSAGRPGAASRCIRRWMCTEAAAGIRLTTVTACTNGGAIRTCKTGT